MNDILDLDVCQNAETILVELIGGAQIFNIIYREIRKIKTSGADILVGNWLPIIPHGVPRT